MGNLKMLSLHFPNEEDSESKSRINGKLQLSHSTPAALLLYICSLLQRHLERSIDCSISSEGNPPCLSSLCSGNTMCPCVSPCAANGLGAPRRTRTPQVKGYWASGKSLLFPRCLLNWPRLEVIGSGQYPCECYKCFGL